MSILLLLAGAVVCGAASWFGITRMKLLDYCILMILVFTGNVLIEAGLK